MLTPSAVTNAKPQTTAYKLTDERGMYLLVKPEGGKLWRLDYRRPGTKKRNTLSLGTYPDVSLKRAREKRDEARKLLADGIDPGDKRKAEAKAGADTFEAVAREWFAKYSPQWAEDHANRNIRRLERDVFPWIGSKPLASVTALDILAVLERIDARGARETAHRARTNIGQVIRYGMATGRTNSDPTVALRGAIPPATERNHAAVTDPDKVGELLRAIDGYNGHFPTRCALQLAPMFFVRPGELRQAEWAEFDLDAAQWNLPAHKMKMRQPHIVPLATQAVAILRELYPLTGKGRYVFPGGRSPKRPMSNNATNAALRRMGFDKDTMTTHGFRAMARTILDEGLGFRPDYIEHQLAHAVRDPNGRAYNRTAHLPERRKMMQAWADYLDALRESKGKVVAIRRKAAAR
ncbi:MAG TPA: integrase arm-type DNA-binding domain-containing protein [Rhodanobacteraceae bacterium]|nr:integrase arm-type DNA-binding domain-containing protein [Rhodanobacteraceae bacterium]